ncbi:serine/threonine-protein kinase [Streptomyces sp. NPDC005551]|uniref:serine/threonine-protein kinase n=1 Tax=unclassified Streptomyces TaxID=2593676 RepID=UPI0033CCC06E
MDGIGLVAGRYRPVGLLGRGGMGVVYEAVDEVLGRRVAVKMLTAVEGLAADSEALERFMREARALARIDHPSVVTLYDTGVHDGTPYLVMQVLDGMTLADLVAATGPLPPAAVASVASQVADALAAAHAAGVLHRDVKPSNVGIDRGGRVVLQDFGLARLAGEAVITRTGMLMGTPQFIAPEAIRGALPEPAADLYGLGACMYLMITGELPFGATMDVGAIVEKALGDGIPRLAGRTPPYPVDLTVLVDRLCEQDPADRPQRVETVEEELRGLADGGTALLAGLLARHIRAEVLEGLAEPPGALGSPPDGGPPARKGQGPSEPPVEAPEYDWDQSAVPPLPQGLAGAGWGAGAPDGGALSEQDAGPSFRRARRALAPPTLSDATRRLVLSSMTASNALSRQREAVNLVLRGELREAAQMLSVIVPVCLSSLGPDHLTTLTSQYWQAVCLARLDAGDQALDLFSQVNKRVGRRTDGIDD